VTAPRTRSGAPGVTRPRIGIVGLGFGARIAERLREGGLFDVAATCDPVRQPLSGVPAIGLDELLARTDITAVGLFTPPAGRAALVRRIVRAGKHVMTTKPFELDPEAAADVLAEARHLGRAIHLNSPAPGLPPDLAQIERWRREYGLGDPVAATAQVWTSYHERADGSWYDDADRCPVAPVLRLGVYLVNDLVSLLGPAATVQVTSSRLRTGRPTADNAQLAIGFAVGALATVQASFCVDDGNRFGSRLTVAYTDGVVTRQSTVGSPVGDPDLALTAAGGRTASVTTRGGSGDYQWDVFRRAVLDGPGDETAHHAAIVSGVRVLAAMARAERSGRAERVLT
jgi:predicted dehydrogenase